jgi:hypothetical protein
MSDHSIRAKINVILDALAEPVTVAEANDGWTKESKASFKVFFEDLLDNLCGGQEIPPICISRAMDAWGIVNGEVLVLAAQISNDLRSVLRAFRSPRASLLAVDPSVIGTGPAIGIKLSQQLLIFVSSTSGSNRPETGKLSHQLLIVHS